MGWPGRAPTRCDGESRWEAALVTDRKAALAFEKEQERRKREHAKEEAVRQKERERQRRLSVPALETRTSPCSGLKC